MSATVLIVKRRPITGGFQFSIKCVCRTERHAALVNADEARALLAEFIREHEQCKHLRMDHAALATLVQP